MILAGRSGPARLMWRRSILDARLAFVWRSSSPRNRPLLQPLEKVALGSRASLETSLRQRARCSFPYQLATYPVISRRAWVTGMEVRRFCLTYAGSRVDSCCRMWCSLHRKERNHTRSSGGFIMKVTKDQIARDLRALGLENGDVVLMHSALSALGEVEGGADTVIDALLAVIGKEGTLAMPTMSSGVFRRESTPSNVGRITEVFRQRPGCCAVCTPRTPWPPSGRGPPSSSRIINSRRRP